MGYLVLSLEFLFRVITPNKILEFMISACTVELRISAIYLKLKQKVKRSDSQKLSLTAVREKKAIFRLGSLPPADVHGIASKFSLSA